MKHYFFAAFLISQTFSAQAHVVLDQSQAQAGSYHKLTFRIGHGCDGSATNTVSVIMPDGVTGAKPMPKAGWTIAIANAALAQPITSHGKTITTDVHEITWSGGSLPDAYFDEFSIQVKLPDSVGKLYFKVSQVCEQGRLDWTEIPPVGEENKKLKSPAVVLDVINMGMEEHHH